MKPLPKVSRWTVLALSAAAAVAVSWLLWATLVDPRIPFLSSRAGGEWITYPTPATTLGYRTATLDATFSHSFEMARAPARATLRVRWFRQGEVRLNGSEVARSRADASWKEPVEVDVARFLRAGENTLEIRVANDSGPPAAWLALEADALRLGTDALWRAVLAGASERAARLATVPMSMWGGVWLTQPSAYPSRSPVAAARANLPLLLLFALTSVGLGAFVRRRTARIDGAPALLGQQGALLVFLAVAGAWGLLFWRACSLPFEWGFDARAHGDYIRFLLERGQLPVATDGLQMFQPPLYYLLAAGALWLAGHSTFDAAGTPVVLLLGWLIALVQAGAILTGLRLAFADRVWPVVTGVTVAACIPIQIYISTCVSNEGLHAALTSLALVLALRILSRKDTAPGPHVILGVALGLAALTKATALVTIAVVAAVLAGRLLAQGVRATRVWLRTLGTMSATLFVVCGWHYLRVTAILGRPLVGAWDPEIGYTWSMDPGYRTSGQLFSFGRALATPLFSGCDSFLDGLYSTLWGDGLLGGASLAALAPPWNRGLMMAGYLLALVPSTLLLVGLGRLLRQLIRRPRPVTALLLGVLAATTFAIVGFNLKLPYCGATKAHYGLSALLAAAYLAGAGGEAIARRRASGALVCALLGTWGLCSYFTYWVTGSVTEGKAQAQAHLLLDPQQLLDRAETAWRQGRAEEAVTLLAQSSKLSPDYPGAWEPLAARLAEAGRPAEAVAAYREALRVTPRDPDLHARLAALYETTGFAPLGRYHRHLAQILSRGAS